MQILIDDRAGFCRGVLKTIDTTEDLLKNYKDKEIYVLGEIIHNPLEISRLEKLGLKIAKYEDLWAISENKNSILIIRAHGEPPKTYRLLEDLGIKFIDATCSRVQSLQKIVQKHYNLGYQILIYGKYKHPETIGLCGFCNETSTVLGNEEDTRNVELSAKPILLISQTTMNQAKFLKIKDVLKNRIDTQNDDNVDAQIEFTFHDTICRSVVTRESSLIEFAEKCDIVIFVSGRNSSNGKYLFETAKSANPKTYFVETVDEIDFAWFDGIDSIGISGATSTPSWYMTELKEVLENKFNS